MRGGDHSKAEKGEGEKTGRLNHFNKFEIGSVFRKEKSGSAITAKATTIRQEKSSEDWRVLKCLWSLVSLQDMYNICKTLSECGEKQPNRWQRRSSLILCSAVNLNGAKLFK